MHSCFPRWIVTLAIFFFLGLLDSPLSTADTLPYDSRTRGFNASPSTLRGDKKTMGMGGAIIGLGDSLFAGLENPAGLAMTLPGTTLQGSQNFIYDEHVQDSDFRMSSPMFAVGGPAYPWGFSLSLWTPYTEGGPYTLNDLSEDVQIQNKTKDLRFSVARIFFKNRLSLGLGLSLATATRAVYPAGNPNTVESESSSAFGYTAGALYQLPHRWLLGLAYQSPLKFSGDSGSGTLINDFFQPTSAPWRLSLGVGHIRNRFFRYGLSLVLIGKNPSPASLINDEGIRLGEKKTYQIRLGAHYEVLEYRLFRVSWSLGTYLEQSRQNNHSFRPHLTSGLGVSAWIIDAGFAVDYANAYVNYTVSYGINFIEAARTLGLVGPRRQTYFAGAFPSLSLSHEFGLPRALVRNRHNQGGGTDLIKMGKEIQKNMDKSLERFEDFIEDNEDAEEEVPPENLSSSPPDRAQPTPKKKKKK